MKRTLLVGAVALVFASSGTLALADDNRHGGGRHGGGDHGARGHHDNYGGDHSRSGRHGGGHDYRGGRHRHHDSHRSYGYAAPSYYGYQGYSPYAYSGYGGGWAIGQVLPHQHRRYIVHNYRDYGWTPPPRGHAYYRTDAGDVLLVAIATGVILSVLSGY